MIQNCCVGATNVAQQQPCLMHPYGQTDTFFWGFHGRSTSRRQASEIGRGVPSTSWRAQGKPDAGCTRGLVCSEKSTRVRNHRFNRSDPAFPAQRFYGLYVLFGVPGLIASVARKSFLASLIPASGDQDHAISPSASAAFVNCADCVHRIPRQHL